MQLTIIKKNKLTTFVLPEKPQGNFWITDFENGRKLNLLNIEAENNEWKLISNNDAFLIDNKQVMIPYTILKKNAFYLIKNNYKNETYYLYCCDLYDKNVKEYGLSDKPVVVGSGDACTIKYKLQGIPAETFIINKKENNYYLDLKDNNYSVYVNKKIVTKSKRLEYGDIIFCFGLKLILLRKNSKDYILVNNPNNMVEYNASFVNAVISKNDFVEDYNELSDDSLYKEIEYFYRTPHFYEEIKKFEVSIDTPPSKKSEEENPAILTIGPMITMSMTSVVMLMSNISSIQSGDKDIGSAKTSIIMCGAMLASSLLWPTLTRQYQKYSDKRYEKKRQKEYRKYIEKKEKEVCDSLEKQKNTLVSNYFNVTDCQNIIRGHNVKLWQRRLNDEDFLTLPVGIGNLPMDVNIKYPEEHFSLEQDSLLDIARELGKKERILQNIPITYSFFKHKATGIVGNQVITKEFADRLLLQIMANYSYDEVKVVLLTSSDNENDWDYLKILPYVWSNDKTFRFFGASNDDYREIMYVLEKTYNERRKENNKEYKPEPHYVVITDAIKSIDSYEFLKNIMSSETNYGFSVIMLVDKITALPNECKNFIKVTQDECEINDSITNSSSQKFKIDFSSTDEIFTCAKELANIPIDIKEDMQGKLPDVLHFLEMYQVGKVVQLNALSRWKKSNPVLSLQVPVGIGKNGELINLDLHEKYHGPHGLIAGTTGSGKSEFIITYILSLAINYSPLEVQIILIDYKGGSLAGAFVTDSYSLPHIAGTITNLDGNELNRSLASIESEIKRRQREFNNAKKVSAESTMDIYKYQRLWREGRLKDLEPIAHLFIISDEFAELKEQQPEFMEKLVSAARVGRSLGIHLVLATQKPGGVVNDQIWSNTRFRVCLKVQDTSDSQEVIKKPDAAYLKKTGMFYLQVGTDEVYTLGQSAWAGGKYYARSTFKKDVDNSVNMINNIGFITTSKEVKKVNIEKSYGEELPNVVRYLSDVAGAAKIKIKKLWLEKIPGIILVDNLKQKYGFKKKDFYLEPIIGEYDDPNNQIQNVLNVPFSKLGNVLIYGITGSGKEDFISTLIYSTITSYTPNEVNFYIMDFGSETLKIYNNFPHVGGIVTLNEKEKLENLIKMLTNELEKRKKIFSSFGGSYNDYISTDNEKMPNIITILNNYDNFVENYEEMAEEIDVLSRDAFKYGIFFIITANRENSVRFKTRQNFALTYVLAQNSDDDYSSILGNCRGKIPAKIKGRGLFKKDYIYEFQTASISKENPKEAINSYLETIKNTYDYKAKRIPVLPDVVDFETIKDELKENSNLIPIGVNKNTLNIETININKNPITLIATTDLDQIDKFVNCLLKELNYLYKDVLFINNTEKTFNSDIKKCNEKPSEIVQKFSKYIEDAYKIYESNSFDKESINTLNKYTIVIYSINTFINKLNDEALKLFKEMMQKNSKIELLKIIIIDNVDSIKAYTYEEWFKQNSDTSCGLWIGYGIAEQSLFKMYKINREDRDEITNEYGYIINNSKQSKVKILSSFDSNVNKM